MSEFKSGNKEIYDKLALIKENETKNLLLETFVYHKLKFLLNPNYSDTEILWIIETILKVYYHFENISLEYICEVAGSYIIDLQLQKLDAKVFSYHYLYNRVIFYDE